MHYNQKFPSNARQLLKLQILHLQYYKANYYSLWSLLDKLLYFKPLEAIKCVYED